MDLEYQSNPTSTKKIYVTSDKSFEEQVAFNRPNKVKGSGAELDCAVISQEIKWFYTLCPAAVIGNHDTLIFPINQHTKAKS